jgi:peroxiredoxin Q/BCP
LADVRGGDLELARVLRLRRAALVFYQGSWCRRCTQHLVGLAARYATLREENTEVIAISNETTRQGQGLIDRLALPFPLLMDPHNSVIAQYDLLQERRGVSMWLRGKRIDVQPTVVIVDRDGSVGWYGRVHHRRAQLGVERVVAAAHAIRERQRGGPNLELVADRAC